MRFLLMASGALICVCSCLQVLAKIDRGSVLAWNEYEPATKILSALHPVQGASDRKGVSMREAIRLAAARHPAILGKKAEVSAQSDLYRTSRMRWLPTISTAANNLNETREQGAVSIDQPLHTFGKFRADSRVRAEEVKAEKISLLSVQRNVFEAVGTAYLQAKFAHAQIVTAQANVQEHEALVDFVARRKLGQLGTGADVNLAESRLLLALTYQDRHQYYYESSLRELEDYVGAEVTLSLDTAEATLDEVPTDVVTLTETLLDADASIQEKRQAVSVAKWQKKRDNKAIMPTLSVRYEREFLDDSLTNLDQERFGIVLQSSIEGLGLVARSRTSRASHLHHAALMELRYAREEAQRRVSALSQEMKMYLQMNKRYRALLSSLEASLESARRQYDAGRGSWLELLNLQREYHQQQSELLKAELSLALVKLEVAVRTGVYDTLVEV